PLLAGRTLFSPANASAPCSATATASRAIRVLADLFTGIDSLWRGTFSNQIAWSHPGAAVPIIKVQGGDAESAAVSAWGCICLCKVLALPWPWAKVSLCRRAWVLPYHWAWV